MEEEEEMEDGYLVTDECGHVGYLHWQARMQVREWGKLVMFSVGGVVFSVKRV